LEEVLVKMVTEAGGGEAKEFIRILSKSPKSPYSGFKSSADKAFNVLAVIGVVLVLIIVITGGTFIYKIYYELLIRPSQTGQIPILGVLLIGFVIIYFLNKRREKKRLEIMMAAERGLAPRGRF
jgi:hypothetical protein